MIPLPTSTGPRDGVTFAWCPSCQGPQPCAHCQGTTDWQTIPVYTCRACGRVTHDPVIRLTATPLSVTRRNSS